MNEQEVKDIKEGCGIKLKGALEMQERTAAWAAKKIGVSESYVGRVIKGELVPSLETAFRILEFVGELKKLSKVS